MEIDRRVRIAVVSGGLTLLAGGCAQTVEVQTFVLDAEITTVPQQVPLHVTTPASREAFTISPSASFGTGTVMTGDVEGSSPSRGAIFYPVDTIRGPGGQPIAVPRVPEDNLTWARPDYSLGLDIDYAGSNVALALGANYATSDGVDLWGWRTGVGFFGQTEGGLGIRLDLGVAWQKLAYDVSSAVVVTESWQYLDQTTLDTTAVAWYKDIGEDTGFGYYIGLTFNTADADWPVNGFLQVSWARQSLFDFEPSRRVTTVWMPVPIFSVSPSGGEATTAATLLSLTPGIFVELSENVRLLAGARVWWDVSGTITSGEPGTHPFVQLDFILPTSRR